MPPSSRRIRGFPPLLLFGIQGPRFGNEWETGSSGHWVPSLLFEDSLSGSRTFRWSRCNQTPMVPILLPSAEGHLQGPEHRACAWAFKANFHLPLEASYSWIWAMGSSLPVGASLIEQGSGRRVSGQGTEIRLPAAQTFAEVALKLHLLPHGQIPGRPLGAPAFTVTMGLLPARACLPGPC